MICQYLPKQRTSILWVHRFWLKSSSNSSSKPINRESFIGPKTSNWSIKQQGMVTSPRISGLELMELGMHLSSWNRFLERALEGFDRNRFLKILMAGDKMTKHISFNWIISLRPIFDRGRVKRRFMIMEGISHILEMVQIFILILDVWAIMNPTHFMEQPMRSHHQNFTQNPIVFLQVVKSFKY